MLTLQETKQRARSYLGYEPWTIGMCLKLARTIVGVGAREPHANAAWDTSTEKHPFNGNYNAVPPGVLFCWRSGTYGHIVYTLGGGLCVTNDFGPYGYVTIAKMENITARWGQQPMGWISEVNGVKFWRRPRHRKPRFSVAGAQKAMRLDPYSGEANSHARAVATLNLLERRIWTGNVPRGNKRGYIGYKDQNRIKKQQRRLGGDRSGVLTLKQIRQLNERNDGTRRWRLVDVPKKQRNRRMLKEASGHDKAESA